MRNNDMKTSSNFEDNKDINEAYIGFEKERRILCNQILQLQAALSEEIEKNKEKESVNKKNMESCMMTISDLELKINEEKTKSTNLYRKLIKAEEIIESINICRYVGSAVSCVLNAIPYPVWPFTSKSKLKVKVISDSGIFDSEWYLNNNKDVLDAGIDPIIHYVEFGAYEGRSPSSKFPYNINNFI